MKTPNFSMCKQLIFLAAVCLLPVRFALACGSEDFAFVPDGSGTPTLEFVVSNTVADVGNVTFGTSNGTITQTQTLRIDPTGLLLPDNSCSANTAFVLIEKTGILNMKGGGIETVSLRINGPVAGDAALGGIFTGFGSVIASGDGVNPQSVHIQSATINPVGLLSLGVSQANDQVVITDSVLKVFIGGGTSNMLDINSGNVQFTNTKLLLDFPANFSANVGDRFTLMKIGGTRTGLLSRGNGTALNEGDLVPINGINLKLTYAGGAGGKDIELFVPDAPTNTAPTISTIANQTTNEDTAKGPLAFTIGDSESPDALTVTAASSNLTLLPLSGIALSGIGVNRSITLTPALNQSGSALVTLTVSDGDLTAKSQFTLTVTAVNDPPTISAIANQSTNEDTSKGPIAFTVNDVETPNGLTVTATSSNTTLLPVTGIVLGGSGANRTVTLSPVANKNGSVNVTLTVSDGTLTDTSQFTLTVIAVNDLPLAQNQSVTTDLNLAKAITLQASDIDGNTLSYSIASSPTHGTLSGTAPNLTYTPTVNYSGADSFTFRANDGAANSNTATVSITVKPTPVVSSFTPLQGKAGTVVIISGFNFSGATQVRFNGTTATFTVDSNTQITATAPIGVTTGKISVTTPEGSATSTANFVVENVAGAPSFSINDVALAEGDSGTKNATLTITLSAVSDQTTTVNAIPSNGSARSPGDYTSGGARLVFAPGETSKTFSVPIVGDLLNEINETIFVILSSPVNANIGRGRGVITITNDDAIPSIAIDNVSIGEGNSGQRIAAFRLKLSAPSGQLVKVTAATADETTTAGNDYVALAPTQIAFTTGTSFAYARVLINGDLLTEANETFLVNLSSPQNATITDNQALGTILNDDSAPSLTINNAQITEGTPPVGGAPGTKNLVFTVTLSKASGQNISVNYATANGIARSDSDYVAKSGTLIFAPGSALTQTISVVINSDATIEGDETLFVLLSAAANATVGTARGTGTILNDDSSG